MNSDDFVLIAIMVFIIVMMALSDESNAQERTCDQHRIIVGGWSNHFIGATEAAGGQWNEQHKAVGFGCDQWSAYYFRNSYDRDSFAVSRTFYADRHEWFEWGLYTGVWSGYEDFVGEPGVVPVAAPRFNFRVDHHIWVSTLVTPPIQADYVEWRF